jgi:fatty acid desaturase
MPPVQLHRLSHRGHHGHTDVDQPRNLAKSVTVEQTLILDGRSMRLAYRVQQVGNERIVTPRLQPGKGEPLTPLPLSSGGVR